MVIFNLKLGRSWKAEELRLKSNEDLHKLWYICVKEKNLLLADQILTKKTQKKDQNKYKLIKLK
jgi:large subunit ribosomal protein L47